MCEDNSHQENFLGRCLCTFHCNPVKNWIKRKRWIKDLILVCSGPEHFRDWRCKNTYVRIDLRVLGKKNGENVEDYKKDDFSMKEHLFA